MKQRITLVDIERLLSHEEISFNKVRKVQKDILERGFLVNPVVADKKTLIILDGHHRVRALKSLRAKSVPVFLVNYDDQIVRVYLRRKKILMKIIKDYVRQVGLSKKLFPSKTTRHLIKNRPRNINYKLEKLL